MDRTTFASSILPGDTVIHLVGVSYPDPSKVDLFRSIDLVSIRECAAAAKDAGAHHFIYLSVAHPTPVMKEYVEVRKSGEQIIQDTRMHVTIVRPWYVLGPGHRWPIVLSPLYALASLVPSLRDGAQRLGLVTIRQMVNALLFAVRNIPEKWRVIEVPDIRRESW